MKNRTKHYRLPGGKTTKSVIIYCDAWARLANTVAKLLDCDVMAKDPGIRLKSKNSGWTFDIPEDVAQKIIDISKT